MEVEIMDNIEKIIESLQSELKEKKHALNDLMTEKDYIINSYEHCDEKKRKMLQKQMEISENKFLNLYTEVLELNNKIKKLKKLML